jgi:hypothetical protein
MPLLCEKYCDVCCDIYEISNVIWSVIYDFKPRK